MINEDISYHSKDYASRMVSFDDIDDDDDSVI